MRDEGDALPNRGDVGGCANKTFTRKGIQTDEIETDEL